MYFCGLIGHQDIKGSLSLAYGENRESGDSVIGIITSVTYPQTGNMEDGSN